MQEHLATFLARAESDGVLPRFVKRELASFLECGIPAHGFVVNFTSLPDPARTLLL